MPSLDLLCARQYVYQMWAYSSRQPTHVPPCSQSIKKRTKRSPDHQNRMGIREPSQGCVLIHSLAWEDGAWPRDYQVPHSAPSNAPVVELGTRAHTCTLSLRLQAFLFPFLVCDPGCSLLQSTKGKSALTREFHARCPLFNQSIGHTLAQCGVLWTLMLFWWPASSHKCSVLPSVSRDWLLQL